MGSRATVTVAITRLSAHYRVNRSDADLAIVVSDWASALKDSADELIERAADTWVLAYDRFPSLSQFLEATNEELRIVLRARAAKADDELDPRRVPNPTTARRALTATRVLRLPPALDWAEMEARAAMNVDLLVEDAVDEILRGRRGGDDPRGHDHKGGASGCPVCRSHDHSSARWREDCPDCGGPLPELYDWSTCRGCDGSGWVATIPHGHGPVYPCPECNAESHELWRTGHFRANHRCEVCSPSSKRKAVST